MAPSATLFMAEPVPQTPVVKLGGSIPAPQSQPAAVDGQPLSPTPELLEFLAAESAKLETATPWEIVRWGVDHYFPKLTMATAFGPEGCVIIHMLAQDRAARACVQSRYRLSVQRNAGAARADRRALRHRSRIQTARHHGRRIRSPARRPALQDESRSVLLRPQGESAAKKRRKAGTPG